MVIYRYNGIYIKKTSGCGSCGSKKTTIELRPLIANIRILNDVWSFDPNQDYEFSDEEAIEIERLIAEKKYDFVKK